MMQINCKQTPYMRNFRGATDLQPIVLLINICCCFDKLDGGSSVTELKNQLDAPFVDKNKDIRLWEDVRGNLIAYGTLWIGEPSDAIDGFLSFYIHPHMRGKDLEFQIFQWAETRMAFVKIERGFPVKLRVRVRDTRTERIALLEKFGFTCDRFFFRMERSLVEPVEQPQFQNGFTLSELNPITDKLAWLELLNESFLDHWNHHPVTLETLEYWLNEPHYKPSLDLIAVADDGSMCALCNCEIKPEYSDRIGKKVGFIGLLGTRRNYRRMGLGRAMLLAGLQRLSDKGMEFVRLGVDADNPNGALRLYESVGFSKKLTTMVFFKDI
ncbi:MAG: GNAT family N-acetyltransferase [Scytonematopsis contorta HA4267-MV1]|jgi:mycothiol synthase|nr:GNAT family N-acetyltransferase [Scytonematopsis contorta HA4267-MV1]